MTLPGKETPAPVPPVPPLATPAPTGKEGQEASAGLTVPFTPEQQKFVAELVRKETQSRVDKQIDQSLGGLTRWQTEVREATANFDAAVSQLKAAGVIPADADTSAARTKVVTEAVARANDADSGQGGAGGDPESLEGLRSQVTALGETEARRWGLPADAPEIAMVKTSGSPEDYLSSIRAAGQAFVKRTGAPMPQGAPSGTELPVDLGGGSSGNRPNPIENITDPDQLFGIAFGSK